MRAVLAHELLTAAREEVARSCGGAAGAEDRTAILAGAEAAFEALETLLVEVSGGGKGRNEGDGEWFLGASEPGMLDAAVFAYTHCILELGIGMEGPVERCEALVRHRQRILSRYFTPSEQKS